MVADKPVCRLHPPWAASIFCSDDMQMREIRDIVISAVALAAAFAIAFEGGYNAFFRPESLAWGFVLAIFSVSLGFIAHEMGHRFFARRYGCYAEFHMWLPGLLIALALSLTGFVFAAPGAVVIHPKADLWGKQQTVSGKQMGIIAAAGPVINLVIAAGFFIASFFVFAQQMLFAASINIWLGLFNMIPFPPLDGQKIFAWDRRIWLALVVILGVGLFFI